MNIGLLISLLFYLFYDNYSPSDAVYGQPLRLPGDLFVPNATNLRYEILQRINTAVSSIQKLKHHDPKRYSYVPNELLKCTHVFLRDDTQRPPLTPAYKGPFKVLNRNNKVFLLEKFPRPISVSIDRLKPAFILSEISDSLKLKTRPMPHPFPLYAPTKSLPPVYHSSSKGGN